MLVRGAEVAAYYDDHYGNVKGRKGNRSQDDYRAWDAGFTKGRTISPTRGVDGGSTTPRIG